MIPISRRAFGALALAAQGPAPLVDTHVHLFDPQRFPYHSQAVYKPAAATLDNYAATVRSVGITHSVIVHPEPYQDDHTYLEYCFAHEPSRLFFKGTCLFDPIDPATPDRIQKLHDKNPGRIIALRIHCNRQQGVAPARSGAIRDRDLKDPAFKATFRKLQSLRMAAQFHIIPLHAPEVRALCAEFPAVPAIIDHLARSAFGTPARYAQILEMAKLPNVIMKFSGVGYSSKEEYPYRDVRALVRQTYNAFGPDRLIWGGLGMTPPDYAKARGLFDEMFAFASESDCAKIRGGNAVRLFWS